MASSKKLKNKSYDYDWIEDYLFIGDLVGEDREVRHGSWPPGYRITYTYEHRLTIRRSIKYPFMETKIDLSGVQFIRLRDLQDDWYKI